MAPDSPSLQPAREPGRDPRHDPRHDPRRGLAVRRAVALVGVVALVLAGVVGTRWVLDRIAGARCEFRAGSSVETWSPEQAANAATISMVSLERGLQPRAATVALATAIQESKLRNLTYGHADSLGLFQQRPSQGWGTEEQVQDPVFASNAFFAALVDVGGWEDLPVTEAAQAVQRSAYPEAYAEHEGQARVLASVLTGQTHAGLTCRLGEVTAAGSATSVVDKAQRTFGADAEVVDGAAVLHASAADEAWAIASWAVAHAEVESVRSVRVDDQVWSRTDDPTTWRPATGSSAGSGSGDGFTVVVQVAPAPAG